MANFEAFGEVSLVVILVLKSDQLILVEIFNVGLYAGSVARIFVLYGRIL